VPWSGAPDCPVCHRTVSGAPGPYNSELATFGFLQRHPAIIHRTVRCATGLSGAPSGATALQRNGRLHSALTALQYAVEVRTEVRGAPNSEQYLFGAAPDCPGPLEDKSSNGRLRPNPNGWVTWLAPRTIRWRTGLSSAPIDSSHPQRLFWWLRAINTPQSPSLQPSKHSSLSIQYKSKVQHSKTQIKATDPIKVPNSILVC
jgi:hypothetical protein